jgi:hypothetical protein
MTQTNTQTNNNRQLTLPTGITLTSRSATFDDNLPRESWVQFGRLLRHCRDATHFWVADWLSFGRKKYTARVVGETVEQLELPLNVLRTDDKLNRLVERPAELSKEHLFAIANAKLDEIAQRMLHRHRFDRLDLLFHS